MVINSMKIKLILFWMIAAILPLSSFAQGVDFKELTMREALALAKKEKKMVFVDFYTTWCGPCKMMTSEVFMREQVGTYFNRMFVNLKMDAEKGEGVELAKKYQVKAYPTFVVLKADGTEVYRTSGARPAGEFIDKIRKGIDPKWSPEGLTRRYKKGERTPELVNEYALLQMETGNNELGDQVIREYFDKLPDKKKVKPENFFLYTRYALNYRDPKASYMFANKDRFVKENGREKVDSLLYDWLRQQVMPFVLAPIVADMDVNEGEWIRLKGKIRDAVLSNGEGLAELEEIAEVRLKNSMKDYLDICREKFPQLEDRDRLSILMGFAALKERNEEIRQAAADLLRDNLNVVEGFNRQVLYSIMLELEGKREFRLRAAIDAVENGKVVVSYFSKGRFVQEEHEFNNHMLNIRIAGKDTLAAGIRFLCDELATSTARGTKQNPHFSFMIVPGEFAVLKLDLEKGKVPVVRWERGGPVNRDFVRLNYDLQTPEEEAYNQLIIDNTIQGGDIRDYPREFQRSFEANKRKTMEFIRGNPDSYIALVKLAEHYIWFDENEAEDIYSRFPENLKGNPYGRVIAQRLKRSRDFRTGRPAKNFEKKDMNGKTVSLEKLRGKYVLLDFWASWCGPCIGEMPNVHKAYDLLHDKGFEVISISTDRKESDWRKAMKEKQMEHFVNLRDTKGVLHEIFNRDAIPFILLLDPQGRIVAKELRGKDIYEVAIESMNK